MPALAIFGCRGCSGRDRGTAHRRGQRDGRGLRSARRAGRPDGRASRRRLPTRITARRRPPGRPIVVHRSPATAAAIPARPAFRAKSAKSNSPSSSRRELRDKLVERGRVRVAMTRDDDRYLTLEERAEIARRLGAGLFVSLHMDSAPNPLARGASIYSLSDVASDAEAARFAASENAAAWPPAKPTASVRSHALRPRDARPDGRFGRSRRAAGVASPRAGSSCAPSRTASPLSTCCGAPTRPAVLFEAGYISNADDELLLRTPEHRAAIVACPRPGDRSRRRRAHRAADRLLSAPIEPARPALE